VYLGFGFLESLCVTVVISIFYSKSMLPPLDVSRLPNHVNSCVLYVCLLFILSFFIIGVNPCGAICTTIRNIFVHL
jgi:hypothetical protein